MKRDSIDFHAVRLEHEAIHARLCNWARWARGSRSGSSTLPMFHGYRPDGYHELTVCIPIDSLDAVKLQKLFILLPEKHRWALQWSYVKPWIPEQKVCRVLAVSRVGLSDLVSNGRTMLKNNELRCVA